MLYDIAFLIFSVFYIPTLIFKGKLHGNFLERFGVYGDIKEDALRKTRDAIWIQAVSVGEVALCRSFIPELKKEFPGRSIVLSTITRTGNDLAKKLFSGDAVIIYFPLDLSFIVKKAIGKIRPKLYLMIETEIWPNVLKELSDKRVPAILINGRISDRSFGKYKLAKRFLTRTLDEITSFCMQSDLDGRRIISLGAEAGRVKVTGNMKFDVSAPVNTASGGACAGLKESFGLTDSDEVFVAGSTHSGEEEAVVSVYKELLKDFPKLKLVIAPRHIERVPDVENVIKRLGLAAVRMTKGNAGPSTELEVGPSTELEVGPSTELRAGPSTELRAGPSTELEAGPPEARIYIIDAIGYLNEAYSLAEIVFVGGSLVPHGGQNPIEPAAFGKPVIFGPYMFNFKAASAALTEKNGAIRVGDRKELYIKARYLLKNGDARKVLGGNARNIISENRGAVTRNIRAIKGFVNV